jgi:hypothetical protein
VGELQLSHNVAHSINTGLRSLEVLIDRHASFGKGDAALAD